MPVERSAGIIFFRKTAQGRRYLVIRSSYHGKDGKHHFWDFPKGLLEKGEKGIDAARREAKEEVGIGEMRMIPEFKATVRYFTKREGKTILKFAVLFLAESKTKKVVLSWEHDQYEWLSYEEARKRLSLSQMKEALDEAENFLKRHH